MVNNRTPYTTPTYDPYAITTPSSTTTTPPKKRITPTTPSSYTPQPQYTSVFAAPSPAYTSPSPSQPQQQQQTSPPAPYTPYQHPTYAPPPSPSPPAASFTPISKLLDGIFIGIGDTIHDLDFMLTHKITHIINCSGFYVAEQMGQYGIQYITFKW